MINKRSFLSNEFQTACTIYHINNKKLGDATLGKIIEVSNLRPSVVSDAIQFLRAWSIINLEAVVGKDGSATNFKYYVHGMSEGDIQELYEKYWLSHFKRKGE